MYKLCTGKNKFDRRKVEIITTVIINTYKNGVGVYFASEIPIPQLPFVNNILTEKIITCLLFVGELENGNMYILFAGDITYWVNSFVKFCSINICLESGVVGVYSWSIQFVIL